MSSLTSSSEIRSANEIDYQADIADCRRNGRTECHPESLSISEAVVEAMFDTKNSDRDDIYYVCLQLANHEKTCEPTKTHRVLLGILCRGA